MYGKDGDDSGKGGLDISYPKLRFTRRQLRQLNSYFSDGELKTISEDFHLIEARVDRLVQYLNNVVAMLDDRFSSEFLIKLEPDEILQEGDGFLSYLVRLDRLSTKEVSEHFALIENGDDDDIPGGFARMKFDEGSPIYEKWEEFTEGGFLRRDKIRRRYVRVLELAASSKLDDGRDLARKANCPSKIGDAETMQRIFEIPRAERMFFGTSEEAKKREKFRIRMEETDGGVRMSLEFGHCNNVTADIHLGVGFRLWPSACDYPFRVPLHHGDFLLHLQAATTGFYAVDSPAPLSPISETLWSISYPAAECVLSGHYSDRSLVRRVSNAVQTILCTLNISDKKAAKTLLWFELERFDASDVWRAESFARHVVSILARLASCLSNRRLRCYFAPNDILGQCLSFGEDSAGGSADSLETFLRGIHALSFSELAGHGVMANYADNWILYEGEILNKWDALLGDLSAQDAKGRKVSGSLASPKQTEYLSSVFKGVGICRKFLTGKVPEYYAFPDAVTAVENSMGRTAKDAAFLTRLMLQQAWQRRRKSKRTEGKERDYERAGADVVGIVRNSRDFASDTAMANAVLAVAYDMSRRYRILRYVFKPYLKELLKAAGRYCWYLDEWRGRMNSEELRTMKTFVKLVAGNGVSLKKGLLDAREKHWEWASNVVYLCLKSGKGVDVLFDDTATHARRFLMFSREECERLHRRRGIAINHLTDIGKSLQFTFGSNEKIEGSVVPIRESGDRNNHILLRDENPLAKMVQSGRRYGLHKGLGNIVVCLLTLGKFTMLQEITLLLPEEKRRQALERIQKASKEKQRSLRLKTKNEGIFTEMYRQLPNAGDDQFSEWEDTQSIAYTSYDNGEKFPKNNNNNGVSYDMEEIRGKRRENRIKYNPLFEEIESADFNTL